ncbi:Uncharacterised protein [Mycobacteroides abscessus subsp. abscessus]|nr:Uncharacterised protein [Mycobacteroides abscessus subsp. abscessus]
MAVESGTGPNSVVAVLWGATVAVSSGKAARARSDSPPSMMNW